MSRRTPPRVSSETPIGADVDLDEEDIRLADGTRLTEDAADALVDEVRRSAGRPSLSGRRARSPQIACRVPENLRERAGEVAARDGKTVSELAREALEARIAG